MRSKLASAFSAASTLVAFESLTILTPPPGGYELAPVREPRIARERRLDLPRPETEGPRRGIGGAGVLVVVGAGQRQHRAEIDGGHLPAVAPLGKKALARPDLPAVARGLAGDGECDHRIAAAGLLAHGVGEEAPLVLVDADDRPRRPALGEEAALGGEVAAEAAVAVEVVGREVEKDGDVGLKRARELDLVGGEFEHHDHAVLGRVEVEDPAPDVAADLYRAPGLAEDVGGQRRRRRLAVRSGDGDYLRGAVELLPRRGGEGAEKEADVIVDGDAGVPRGNDGRMRRRVEVRDAGRDDDRLHACIVRGRR